MRKLAPIACLAPILALGCTGGADDEPWAVCEGKCDGGALPALYDPAFYADLATEAGLVPGTRPIVIGLRGIARDGSLHDTITTPAYDDVIAVLRPDGTVLELPASTHPWFTDSAHAPDADGDGVPDVGMIRPGRYRAEPRPASRDLAGAPTFHILAPTGSDRLPGWRDTDHDGTYDDAERAASELRGDALTAVLFHQGGAGAPPAIGCQVLDATSLRAFVTAVGGRNARFDYVLVDAP